MNNLLNNFFPLDLSDYRATWRHCCQKINSTGNVENPILSYFCSLSRAWRTVDNYFRSLTFYLETWRTFPGLCVWIDWAAVAGSFPEGSSEFRIGIWDRLRANGWSWQRRHDPKRHFLTACQKISASAWSIGKKLNQPAFFVHLCYCLCKQIRVAHQKHIMLAHCRITVALSVKLELVGSWFWPKFPAPRWCLAFCWPADVW